MLSFEEAQKICLEQASFLKLSTEIIPLLESVGRVCARDIISGIDVQPFDNSAMDGYALNHRDIALATENNPVILKKSQIIAAGQVGFPASLAQGECAKIMTGAPVPGNATAVVPVEYVKQEERGIVFFQPALLQDNIRHKGEDFRSSENVLKAGHTIRVQDIMVLSGIGVDSVEVYRKPKVVFLTTGNEVVSTLSQPLAEGQIYNSNLYYGLAFLSSIGAEIIHSGCLKDDKDFFVRTLSDQIGKNPDIVVSSGAVSAGDFDFIKSGIESMGGDILFHKIKLKPGKPNLFAKMPNGTLYFGLPGNPVATAVGLRFLVAPVISVMRGETPGKPLKAIAKNEFKKKQGLQMFLKAYYETEESGKTVVTFLEGQESFKVKPFLSMNCWAVIEEKSEGAQSGSVVDIFPVAL